MKNRDRMFIFFYRYYKLIKDFELTDEERLEFYDHVVNYGLFGRKPARKTTVKVRNIFDMVKGNILQANKSFEVVQKEKW